jgi:hypothetical protein
LEFRLFKRKKKDLDLEVQKKGGVTAVGLRVDGKLATWGIGVPQRSEVQLGGAVSSAQVAVEGASEKDLDWQWWYNKKNMGPFNTLEQMKVSTTGVTAIMTGSATVDKAPFTEWKGEKELRIKDVYLYAHNTHRAADIVLHPSGSDVLVQFEMKRMGRRVHRPLT